MLSKQTVIMITNKNAMLKGSIFSTVSQEPTLSLKILAPPKLLSLAQIVTKNNTSTLTEYSSLYMFTKISRIPVSILFAPL